MKCPNCGVEIRSHTKEERAACMKALRELFK